MFTVDGDQVEVEFSGPFSLRVFKDDFEMSCLLICLQSDGISVVCKFHDLSQVLD